MRAADYILYSVFCLLYPRHADFISGGLGIRGRAKHFEAAWERHFKCCREFQELCLAEKRNLKVAVLGAGTLLDLDLQLLAKICNRVDFFDADPLARFLAKNKLSKLSKAGVCASYQLADITGRLDLWDKAAAACLALDEESALRRIGELPALPCTAPALSSYDLIISLNLLSQIPIYWDDRLESSLSKKFEDTRYKSRFEAARLALKRRLQQEHLDFLNQGAARHVLIFSDLYFFYYEQQQSEWEVEDAVLLPQGIQLSDYRTAAQDSWLWHLAPQGPREPEYGSIHQVQAMYLERHLPEISLAYARDISFGDRSSP